VKYIEKLEFRHFSDLFADLSNLTSDLVREQYYAKIEPIFLKIRPQMMKL